MSRDVKAPRGPDFTDIDDVRERATQYAPSAFAAAVAHLLGIIARELRLLRAGVKP